MFNQRKALASWVKVLIVGLGLFLLGLTSALITMRLVIKGREVKLPPLMGQDIVYALETLNELGLGVRIADQEFNSSVPENHIISQTPLAGSFIKQGRDVRVVLSKGSLMVWVPNLAGDSLSLAQLKLKKQGLKTGQLIKIHHNLPSAKVVAQYPLSNSYRARGSQVNLLVSQGEFLPGYVMPDLIGEPLSAATIKVKGLGLEVGQVTSEAYQGAQPQTVISQTPKSGYLVTAGQPVELVVSEGKDSVSNINGREYYDQ
jgi:serine/threonine-protein kinase